jgi:dTDP-4-dehydrorhamnose 3,5-epimerase
MEVTSLSVAGALRIMPRVFSDDRGWFTEAFAATRYRQAGIDAAFVQDNLSSSARHVLRGLHADPRMAKLIQVVRGSAFDVIADARPESPTYGTWCAVTLRASERTQLYIPAGCLHGFLALEDDTLLSYKQSAEYDPAREFGIRWDDPDLAIAWPLEGSSPVLSAKDAANPLLRDLVRP